MSKKHGHHGGAWKVAYADFVTAMMALFMVLWLTSQDPKIKQAVERSFTNPFSSVTKESTGIIPNKDTQAVKSSSGNFDSASAIELNFLRKINTDLMKSLETEGNEGAEDSVKMDLTSEGLSINVFDRAHKPVFEPDSCKFTTYGDWIFSTIAWQIARYKSFGIELDGHTESGRQPASATNDDFDLSSDRANAVRRKLIEHGVMQPQIRKVAGFGATVPMADTDPTSEVNSRVTVLLKPSEKNSSSEAVP